MSDKNNNELTVTEGFAVLANQDVLNEALADDCQGLEFSFCNHFREIYYNSFNKFRCL